jgi:hypothetical protein
MKRLFACLLLVAVVGCEEAEQDEVAHGIETTSDSTVVDDQTNEKGAPDQQVQPAEESEQVERNWLVELLDIDANTWTVINLVITVLVILFCTLAMAQIIIFDLSKESKETIPPELFKFHHAIAQLGIGAAGYALFVSHTHFSTGGYVGIVLTIIGIALVGSMIQKFKKRKEPKKREEVPEDKIVTRMPDETKMWCPKCQAHTTVAKGNCAHCNEYWVFSPTANRKASYGCGGCAAVPLLFMVWALLAQFEQPGVGLAIAGGMVILFIPIALFPAFFLYQNRLWKKWAIKTKANVGEQVES